MPKPKKPVKRTVRTETFTEDEPETPEVPWSEEELDNGDMQVQSILDSVGPGEVKIKIAKWGPKGKAYCFSLDGGPVDEDFIQQQFGGGRYQGQIFKNGIYTGHSFELNIAERMTAVGAHAGGVADLQARMMQQQIDFLKDIILQRGNAQQTPVGELVEAVTKVQGLNGGASLGEKAVELLLKGFELGKTISGGDKSDSWSEVIREALPVVGEMMKQRQPARQPEREQQQPEVNSLPSGEDGVILQGIAYLKTKAMRGGDPALYIDWMLDNADEPQYQPILHFILTSEFSALEQIDAEIGKPPYDKFFRAVYDGLRSAFSEQDQVEVDTGGKGGDAGDTPGNGTTGKGGKPRPATKKVS